MRTLNFPLQSRAASHSLSDWTACDLSLRVAIVRFCIEYVSTTKGRAGRNGQAHPAERGFDTSLKGYVRKAFAALLDNSEGSHGSYSNFRAPTQSASRRYRTARRRWSAMGFLTKIKGPQAEGPKLGAATGVYVFQS